MYDASLARVREGCCDTRHKPCIYHEGWGDGYEQGEKDSAAPDLLEALEEIALSRLRRNMLG